ncbi:MAG TPA: ROK family protein [Polyangiaceae bacterium]|nr:ROK family protein [Polyangiaceae bacterium]
MARPPRPHTLAVDIGGSGVKAIVLDARGRPIGERVRVDTPRPATPARVLSCIRELVGRLGSFDRISVGFPGVVEDGVTKTAPNLHRLWTRFDLAGALGRIFDRPVRALNDAGIQGYGCIEGRGVEMLLTLGTGMGCALFVDGKYVPNLELAHHPFRGDHTYEDWVGGKAYEKVGKKKWNERVVEVVEQIEPIWNPRRIYLGGGNAKYLKIRQNQRVKIIDNVAGLLGGIALWNQAARAIARPMRVSR